MGGSYLKKVLSPLYGIAKTYYKILLCIKFIIMKKLLYFLFLASSTQFLHAQNVGIDVPMPLQKLEVNGAIKIGNTATNLGGTIRYNSGKFEGADGSSWKTLESIPSTAIVMSETEINTNLTDAGYTIVGKQLINFAGYGSAGSWQPISMIDIPQVNGIANATNLWSGNRFLVWGGYYSGNNTLASGIKNLGYVYTPSTNSWSNTTTVGAPVAREKHFSARAANNKVLIFGGLSTNAGGGNVPYADGAIYDPIANSWSSIFSTTGTPTAFSFISAKKAYDTLANKLFTFNWYLGVAYGYTYNVATNLWSTISTTNAPPENISSSAVWLGAPINKWMFWGSNITLNTNAGRLYNPGTNTWSNIAAPPAGYIATAAPVLIWTGSEVIVYGGSLAGADNYSNQVFKYNPTTNTWSNTIATLNKPSPRFLLGTTYGDNKFFIWGGFEKQLNNIYIQVNSGSFYDFDTNTWNEIPITFATPDRRASIQIDWSGEEMYVWGGSSESGRTGALSGGRYNPNLQSGGGFGGYQSKVYYLFQKQ